jgi:hypothetical protein
MVRERRKKKRVILQIKLEVKLPSTSTLGEDTMLVREGKTQLNDLKQVHITP